MFKLIIFVPESHKEILKDALFSCGAGKLGNYDRCSFESLGVGQFRPLKNAVPYSGEIFKTKILEEYKIEMLVDDNLIEKAIEKLKAIHPYEEPAYDLIKLANF